MSPLATLAIVSAILPMGVIARQAPAPPIQNGKVETRQATSIDKELASVGGGAEPAWVGWRVPMVDGDRSLCSTWGVNDQIYARGFILEPTPGVSRPQTTPPSGPVALEAGTGLMVLARMIEGKLERLRPLSDDCPIDAGGRTVYWLNGITPAESLRFLDSLLKRDSLALDQQRKLAESALTAIGFHRDAGATAILDRIATADQDSGLRRHAASSLASYRGAPGFETLRKLMATERDQNLRRSFTTSLGQTRQPGTTDALLALARGDEDPRVRAEAVYWYAQRAGAAGTANVMAIIDKDTDTAVKQRGVSGISTLPGNAGVPTLIELARSDRPLPVRKQAVSALGQSKDPRAIAYLEEIVKK